MFRMLYERLTSAVIQLVRLLIFARCVRFNGFLDRLDSPAEEVGVTHDSRFEWQPLSGALFCVYV